MDGQQASMPPQVYEPYEDEIELMDLLKVLWKWKCLIIFGTLLCAVVAAIVSFSMTKIYKVEMVVAPGLLKIEDNGKRLYIDTLDNIKTMIEGGTFNESLLTMVNENLSDEEKLDHLDFEIKAPKGLNALKVSFETSNKNFGIEILSDLSKLLLEKFQSVVSYYQNEYEIQKEQKENQLGKLEIDISNSKAEIKTTEQKIKNLQQREKELESEMQMIGKNTELLISERNKFLSKKKTDDNVLSALLYSNTIQESIAYLNTLRATVNRIKSDINALNLKIEQTENGIIDLENQKRFIAEEIANIEFRKNIIQNIQILKPPKSSLEPVKPKKKLNILLAGVVGLFLTVFAAFFIEYISKHKDDWKEV